MTTATAQNRLRQIAILISSVDAAAAQQVLMHLPTDVARQVRSLAAQLGSITADEKRRILAEFQRSAGSPARTNTKASVPAGSAATAAEREVPPTTLPDRTALNDQAILAQTADAEDVSSQDDSRGPAWTKMSTSAIVRFVRGERPAVTAVVLSQLAPQVSVEVLQQLPQQTSHDILQRLSRLQNIDPATMATIDEHLSQRLSEYQHHLQGELENSRRISALLAVAPEQLRHQWSQLLCPPAEDQAIPASSAYRSKAPDDSLLPQASSQLQEQDVADFRDAVQPTADGNSNDPQPRPLARTEEDEEEGADAATLPFSKATAKRKQVDRSLNQLEFERILQLPPHALARLLSETDSETVLLALAGATPEFMNRFSRMLNPDDARALQDRLKKIGAIHLRDVDEAQRRIVENVASLATGRVPYPGTISAQRAA